MDDTGLLRHTIRREARESTQSNKDTGAPILPVVGGGGVSVHELDGSEKDILEERRVRNEEPMSVCYSWGPHLVSMGRQDEAVSNRGAGDLLVLD